MFNNWGVPTEVHDKPTPLVRATRKSVLNHVPVLRDSIAVFQEYGVYDFVDEQPILDSKEVTRIF